MIYWQLSIRGGALRETLHLIMNFWDACPGRTFPTLIVYQPEVLPGRRAEEKTLSGVDRSRRLRNSRFSRLGDHSGSILDLSISTFGAGPLIWDSNIGIQHRHSTLAFNVGIQHWHPTLAFNFGIRYWHSTLAVNIGFQHWHSLSIDIQHRHPTLAFNIGIQHQHPSLLSNIDIQHWHPTSTFNIGPNESYGLSGPMWTIPEANNRQQCQKTSYV